MSVTLSDEEYDELTELAEVGRLVEIRGESNSLENIWLAGQPVGKIIESNRKKATRATESSDQNPKGSSGENHPTEPDLLPIERLARIEQNPDLRDTIMADVTPSVERALSIFEHFGQWSKKTPKGRTITSGLKELIETATGTRLAWRQIYRACEALESWSKGSITFQKTSRHGWILVADGRVSSAG